MKCRSCDCILSDFEATRKYSDTNDYVDMCNDCLSKSDEQLVFDFDERTDLSPFFIEQED